MNQPLNLMMPGNPRYQPKDLIPIWGYDNLVSWTTQVELAALDTLHDFGKIPDRDHALLTPELRKQVLTITTSEVDVRERTKTKHDVRALVQLIQKIVGPRLARYFHVPLTSYDALEPGRILSFAKAHDEVLMPKAKLLLVELASLTNKHAELAQVGRTHGQHALPITVGFWLGTILSRLTENARHMEECRERLVGKVSGAVGAYNAQMAFGLDGFEERVLSKLGLKAARASTQILPPEPLAYYLHSVFMFSAALGQLADDCRHLMRSEIGEIGEPFAAGQVGSSTMAQKRNPVTFENVVSMFEKKNLPEMLKVHLCLNSEHQRDLRGSAAARDFPIMVVNTVVQLDSLLREDKSGMRFIQRIGVSESALKRNLEMSGDAVLAEPLYLALQFAGFEGDAHEFVNHEVVPEAKRKGTSLWRALNRIAIRSVTGEDKTLVAICNKFDPALAELFKNPSKYTGRAAEVARACATDAFKFVDNHNLAKILKDHIL